MEPTNTANVNLPSMVIWFLHCCRNIDGSSHGKSPASNKSNFTEKALKLPEVKENVGKSPTFSKSNFTDKALKLPEVKENVQAAPVSKNEGPVHISEPGSHSSKAFPGSIIERTPNIGTNPIEQTAAHGSKPVSRFKMQRR
ncbi:unnamed protein product [Ilex paraguariensis]|uniref:Uncharacterized protein n=1 Tax=Ilex paraguariensis TaxID=185542 RepID=A0ABC8RV44_9AQUA